ncbi:MAG TPA: TIGR03885 family FMN-dependent LLM class oxidoreductase [Longimicrobiales bacterium]|nr:TIGR03885 family FMN-dependent LLM class oxidoreductase [Longimicrobiales bacterium]
MTLIGYHASHEQYAPSVLLGHVQHAAAAGFDAAMCSDHFHPWTAAQGESGFAWSWLGAALQATSLSFGVVNAPGYRYHPAIIAQAAATLAELFPGRFWLAIGSGEWLNEHITGERWPPKPERNRRLRECADVMRALWAGETVTHHGLVTVEDACLYSRPEEPPLLVGAALTPETAEWLGGWADALVTTGQPPAALRRIVDAFRNGGGAGKPMFLQVQLSYAGTEAEAWRDAHGQWRSLMAGSAVLANLRNPAEFAEVGRFVRREDLEGHVRVSTDLEQHVAWLQQDAELGFERCYLHNVSREQERFIDDFGSHVLPALRG